MVASMRNRTKAGADVIARSRDGLSETGDRAAGIAKVGQEGAALHLADPDVCGGKLLAERRIRHLVAAEAVEILEGGLDDQLSHGGRTRNRHQRVVDVEHRGVRERPQILESPLREIGLARADDGDRDQPRGEDAGDRECDPMTARRPHQPVGHRVGTRADRFPPRRASRSSANCSTEA